jgi:hypothetical protein
MKKLVLLFANLLIISGFIIAQNASWCGTHISDEWMQAFYQRDKSHLTHKGGNLPEVAIPIVYHIVGDNNGNGYYGLHELFRSHCELQSLYDNASIRFYIKDIVYVNNTSYYEGTNTYGLFQQNDLNACNVYVVDNMDGVCGYSFVPENWDNSGWSGPNRGGIMLQKGCMQLGNTTYRHEMGHYLNLPHTFYGWEGEAPPGIGQNAPNSMGGVPVERADGSNCNAAGDGFCDTPPDYLSDRWTCNFDRNYRDPLGTLFTVDELNFMSYSNDGCSIYLKDDQLAEVNAAPSNHRAYLLNDPVPPVVSFPTMTGFAPAMNTNNLNPSNILVSWNAVPNAEYYHLQLALFNFNNPSVDIVVEDTFYVITNPSFNAEYEWRVKPISLTNVCTPFTSPIAFSTSGLSANIEVDNSTCSNTPDGSISVTMNQAGTFSYYWSCPNPTINNQIQNVNSGILSNLVPETYNLVVVRSNGDTMQTAVYVLAPNDVNVEINQVGLSLVATVTGGTPPYNYAWNTGAQTLSLSGISSGTYDFIVVDQNGCQKTVSGDFDENATSIKNDASSIVEALNLVPNPSKGNDVVVNVTLQELASGAIYLSDLSGKKLQELSFSGKTGVNAFTLPLNNISKGLYFVSIQIQGKTVTQKLIVQ